MRLRCPLAQVAPLGSSAVDPIGLIPKTVRIQVFWGDDQAWKKFFLTCFLFFFLFPITVFSSLIIKDLNQES